MTELGKQPLTEYQDAQVNSCSPVSADVCILKAKRHSTVTMGEQVHWQ